MSEVKNSTTDIDNNVQGESPKPTPKKRISRAEKARLESEELLKSLGVKIESGRQTRSSRRGNIVVESPKPEPPKRKQLSTPRASKKAKVIESDQTDSLNHVRESTKKEIQITEASAANLSPKQPGEVFENAANESENESNNTETDKKIENTPIESVQPEKKLESESVPQPETIEDSPIDDEPPIEEDSLMIAGEVESIPSRAVEKPKSLESEGVSAVADTTTTIANNVCEPIVTSPPESNKDKDEPIELQSSPSDIDQQEDTVSNSVPIVTEPEAFVYLESSSNEGDDLKVVESQGLNAMDLEVINSDSSLGLSKIQEGHPSSGTETVVPEQPLPLSTVNVSPVFSPNDNSVHSSEQPQNAVESTNNQKPIEIPDNFRTTITVDNPIEETITTTSETLLEPNATTA